jgi:DNA-directed RNA polymerase subunit RPC12/RpoP
MIAEKYRELKQEYPKPHSFQCEDCGSRVMGELRISLFPDRIEFYRPRLCSDCDDTVDGDGWFKTKKIFQITDKNSTE